MAALEIPVCVYRLFDIDGRLLYVGITDRPMRRFNEHAQTKKWWPQVSRWEITQCASRDIALQLEADAIREERPIHNVVHNQANTAYAVGWEAEIQRERHETTVGIFDIHDRQIGLLVQHVVDLSETVCTLIERITRLEHQSNTPHSYQGENIQ